LKSQERDAVLDVEALRESTERRFLWSRSGDRQRSVVRQQGKSAKESGVVFDGIEPADGEPAEVFMRVRAGGDAELGAALPVLGVDPVGYHCGFGVVDHTGIEPRVEG